MDRLAAGIMIAIAALVMNGSLVRDALAGGPGARAGTQAIAAATVSSPRPVSYGLRSGRVLNLWFTRDALRAAPAHQD